MTSSMDCQPLYCPNTFYKQFISVYKIIIHIYKISRNTCSLGHNPVPHREGVIDCANSKFNKQKVPNYSESRDPHTQNNTWFN